MKKIIAQSLCLAVLELVVVIILAFLALSSMFMLHPEYAKLPRAALAGMAVLWIFAIYLTVLGVKMLFLYSGISTRVRLILFTAFPLSLWFSMYFLGAWMVLAGFFILSILSWYQLLVCKVRGTLGPITLGL